MNNIILLDPVDEKASATVDAVATVFLDAAKSRASDSSFRYEINAV